MICPHCGAFFCNDTDDVKTYCTRECMRRAVHSRAKRRRRHQEAQTRQQQQAWEARLRQQRKWAHAKTCWRKQRYEDETAARSAIKEKTVARPDWQPWRRVPLCELRSLASNLACVVTRLCRTHMTEMRKRCPCHAPDPEPEAAGRYDQRITSLVISNLRVWQIGDVITLLQDAGIASRSISTKSRNPPVSHPHATLAA